MLDNEQLSNKAFAAGRLWRPWEHIYAINKLTKGPFIPVYNPSGKYAVRLFFMVLTAFAKLYSFEQRLNRSGHF